MVIDGLELIVGDDDGLLENVGDADGCCDGTFVGLTLGCSVRDRDGTFDALVVGLSVGWSDGTSLTVGVDDTTIVGLCEVVGDMVG